MKRLYWLLPFLLTGVQLLFTLAAMGQIHRDELYASAIGPYWLTTGRVFDGRYCNVGWYAALCAFYGLAGYTVYTARYLRLLFHFLSLLCLVDVLNRTVGKRIGLVITLCIALSPSLLYFNTLQTENGLDLQFLPILLCLCFRLKNENKPSPFRIALFGFLAMASWTAYPTIAFLLPSLLFFLAYTLPLRSTKQKIHTALFFLAGFLLPLVFAFGFFKNWKILIADTQYGGGLFRGGGQFRFTWDGYQEALKQTVRDLFVEGTSYLFWLPEVDFSYPFGFLALLVFMVLTFLACWQVRQMRLPAFLTGNVLVLTLVLGNLDSYLPGLRRQTPLLVVFYFCVAAGYWWTQAKKKGFCLWFGRIAIVLLLISHCYADCTNLVFRKKPHRYRERGWFALHDLEPQASLISVRTHLEAGKPLVVLDRKSGTVIPTKLHLIYAALRCHAYWNGRKPLKIRTLDPQTGKWILLENSLWDESKLPH